MDKERKKMCVDCFNRNVLDLIPFGGEKQSLIEFLNEFEDYMVENTGYYGSEEKSYMIDLVREFIRNNPDKLAFLKRNREYVNRVLKRK